jgi:hypothetical protein
MVLAAIRVDPLLRPVLITATVGLAAIAIAVSLLWSMGLAHEASGLRMLIAVPLALSIALTVVLLLEAHFLARASASVTMLMHRTLTAGVG